MLETLLFMLPVVGVPKPSWYRPYLIGSSHSIHWGPTNSTGPGTGTGVSSTVVIPVSTETLWTTIGTTKTVPVTITTICTTETLPVTPTTIGITETISITATSVGGSQSAPVTSAITVPTGASPSYAKPSSSALPSPNACLSVSKLVASVASASPKATPTVPAELAYDCLHSIPFNQSAASDLLESMRPYLKWQTTISYLKDPPKDYADKVQPPYDFWGVFDGIEAKVTAGTYASEYAFGYDLYEAFQQAHDGHFGFTPDSVGSIFTFGRTVSLASVSEDGKSLPVIYAYGDILAASFGNASFTPSPIVEIDGQNATEYLLNWSQFGSLQDRDALWNNLFYIPAQVSLGTSGTGTGTFSGSGRGRYAYPGATTTFVFANGSTVNNQNFARVLANFANITSGADIYREFFAVPEDAYENALDLAVSTTSSATSSATGNATSSTSSTSTTSTPAPGYPSPIVRQSNNLNGGYFLDQPGFEDVAVLSVPSFVGSGDVEEEFQNVNSELIAAALAANKTKLIIDVSANGGGTILQGYDLFKQLFPSILPYGATRFRAHEAFDILGQEYSAIAADYPRNLNQTDDILDIESSAWNYRTDADVNYEPFTSWPEKYGPHEFGPGPDNFTSIIRWNLSDVLTPLNSGGIYVSGYLNRSNVTVQPFATENIVLVYDGYCASTCTIFSELMRQQAGVKTIALGGRPNYNEIQGVGGVKGTNDYPWSYILSAITEAFTYANGTHQEELNKTALGGYSQLPLYRSSSGPVVNSRDGIREGDVEETPLQFVYEATDCRIFYTPAMVVDQSAVWRTVADTVWGGGNACVAGSNTFYGNKTKRDGGVMRMHGIRRDVDVEAAWKGLSVHTGESIVLGGDSIMLP
ncbi:hypothetical protein E4T38_08569 [Aureobasidium subglaciale]|nr:hypothetical protein E4T38_08569 [Aureobasidium subglaciale]KAI5215116.1 hypothetical protein E4T40_08582 [Aureobasidium subglaciale]KAI5218308.1 hypothetical protein E4T41_08435 [Aureobasidium subglaciale]KAI5256031.1 hypothetical protein E4T46_08470 [Aureobasidium subglaciale]